MEHQLTIYNTLNRKKELFVPLHAPHVGMYVCGPTVYGDPHLGHARPAITFDLLFRYLTHIGYKVRYVRNITDVGHLEHDADEGEDKIAKKARLEQLEPMEVAQYYINRYHKAMDALNVLSPSIEPHASGHIIEQIELVKEILKNGYAYEREGSVNIDVEKYYKDHDYPGNKEYLNEVKAALVDSKEKVQEFIDNMEKDGKSDNEKVNKLNKEMIDDGKDLIEDIDKRLEKLDKITDKDLAKSDKEFRRIVGDHIVLEKEGDHDFKEILKKLDKELNIERKDKNR